MDFSQGTYILLLVLVQFLLANPESSQIVNHLSQANDVFLSLGVLIKSDGP